MSEDKQPCGVLNPVENNDRLMDKDCIGFVEVRTRAGKLIFRLDPIRKLVEWREGKEVELVDISPLMPA